MLVSLLCCHFCAASLLRLRCLVVAHSADLMARARAKARTATEARVAVEARAAAVVRARAAVSR